MTYNINVVEVSLVALREAYAEHRDKIPTGALVRFVCSDLNMDLSGVDEDESLPDVFLISDGKGRK